MNAPESDNKFVPKQTLQPTPELYDLLVSDSMENLAAASIAQIPPITSGSVLHDNGSGTGAASKAIVQATAGAKVDFSIKATDINTNAIEIYKKSAEQGNWPAEAVTMDSTSLQYPGNTFTHSILNALLFVLPNNGMAAVSEAYRTLKPGGVMLANSWHYIPNMGPIQTAAKVTRPEGTPLPRKGLQHWEDPEFIKGVVVKGGFAKGNVKVVQAGVSCLTTELNHFATMLWSFTGGTGASGWLESDEEKWDQAVEVLKDGLQKTDGFKQLDDGKTKLKFIANIVIATK